MGLLRCCTAFEAYCQVYTADVSPDRMLEFLLLNRDFPHAIRYCVEGARQAVEGIQQSGGRRPPEELNAGIGKLHAMLDLHIDQRNSRRRFGWLFCTISAAMPAHS